VATFEKRTGKLGKVTWRVKVRRQNGPFLTRSFPKKSDAETWARSIESRIDAGEQLPSQESRKRTLADAIDRYLEVTLPRSKNNKNASEQIRLISWWRDELGDMSLASIKASTIAEARDSLSKRRSDAGTPISGATLNRYLSALSTVLTAAQDEYGWIVRNPGDKVRRFSDSKSRERFLSDAERDALLAQCDKSEWAPLGWWMSMMQRNHYPLPDMSPCRRLAVARAFADRNDDAKEQRISRSEFPVCFREMVEGLFGKTEIEDAIAYATATFTRGCAAVGCSSTIWAPMRRRSASSSRRPLKDLI
jgi:integrase